MVQPRPDGLWKTIGRTVRVGAGHELSLKADELSSMAIELSSIA
jgi:hypothetical protein